MFNEENVVNRCADGVRSVAALLCHGAVRDAMCFSDSGAESSACRLRLAPSKVQTIWVATVEHFLAHTRDVVCEVTTFPEAHLVVHSGAKYRAGCREHD